MAEPNRVWATTCDRWLQETYRALAQHARKVAKGDRGVLLIEISREEMERQLGGHRAEMMPTWIPAEEFSSALDGDLDMDDAKRQRWQAAVETIDPRAGDVALFLYSEKAKLPITSRLLVVQGGRFRKVH